MTKGTAGILVFDQAEDPIIRESACIRCGKCVSACPIHLMPFMLNQFALEMDWSSFEKYHGMDCIECGSCAYICPAKRHLTQTLSLIHIYGEYPNDEDMLKTIVEGICYYNAVEYFGIEL